MNKSLLKKLGIALGIVALFLALSYGFVPQVLQGKIVNQSDISGYLGMSHEMSEWNQAHPDNPTYWTDSMFGGMPTTAISTRNGGDYTQPLYNLLFAGKRPAPWLFVTLLGAFLLFLALGVSWPVAVGGAIAVAFCSYNLQIIQVGHNTKMQAIALMPWVLAALVYTYRNSKNIWKTLLGAALFGITLSFQIKANHQQISYYLAIMVLIYAIVELVQTIRGKTWKPFVVASALLLVLGVAGIATNTNKLLPLAKYTPYTMRGGSELSKDGGSQKGLDLDYATSWSYGWEELPNLMIPNFNGGASAGAVNPDKSETIQLLKRAGQKNLKETAKHLPLYWGPQPFTAGPMYMGAVSVFLFVLGLFLYRGKEKWWLLAATVLAILMAVGSHFMAFTKFCYNVLPLYNKFRTVSMALVVLQVSLPVLGFLTVNQLVKEKLDKNVFRKGFMWALGLTGGFCALAWLAPGLFGSFTGGSDAQMQDVLVDALIVDRIALFKADVVRSFLFICFAAALVMVIQMKRERKWIAVTAMGLLVILDLFMVDKRYLNADHFTTPKDFNKPFAERPVDQMIKADEDPQYRVLDLTVDVFNSSVPSYHHKNIGGYSPAKLQRYQDLIEHYLAGEINALYKQLNQAEDLEAVSDWMAGGTPVLNALNTRYIILGGEYPPLENYSAFGAAWFVDSAVKAANPDEEIALLGAVDLRHQAVVTDPVNVAPATSDGTGDLIEMTSYAPNELHYKYSCATDRLAVFSEIYYPDGWHATVDGQPLDLIRADWTLRAALLPAGEHEVVMTFLPDSYRTGAAVSRVTSILLILLVLASIGLLVYSENKRKNEQ
ncbi:MAG: YfhO family protein [Bacteroidales bacterium]|nr:YfhO family protein [Bacteroidales bacterium]